MPIHVLDKLTVDQIAAGEVVERPASVVKELVENAIDAGANAVTVEIKNGGIDLIRVTDNGCGIPKEEVRVAFCRHATSKIQSSDDLFSISSLGFRGEALPSIASVTRLELITKRADEITATDFEIDGGDEVRFDEMGAPNGTTFIVKDLFYNTPVRRKFLKTAITEGAAIADLMEKIALSHPNISFRLIQNGQTKLATSGNGKIKDLIFAVFGRETVNEVIPIDFSKDGFLVSGMIGSPVLAKGNRSFENCFINGRYVKSVLCMKAIEDAYAPFMMQHRYPFVCLFIKLPSEDIDVNVHPTKMEVRFRKEAEVYDLLKNAVKSVLEKREMISNVSLSEEKKPAKPEPRFSPVEPFETARERLSKPETKPETNTETKTNTETETDTKPETKTETKTTVSQSFKDRLFTRTDGDDVSVISDQKTPYQAGTLNRGPKYEEPPAGPDSILPEKPVFEPHVKPDSEPPVKPVSEPVEKTVSDLSAKPEQQDLFKHHLISDEGMKKYRLIGQVFKTYWLLELDQQLYILDQHAAHEKLLYERKMAALREKKIASQLVSPPIMVSLNGSEELVLNRFMNEFSDLGYEISSFGGREYAISAVPDDLFGLDVKELFVELLGDLQENMSSRKPEMILSKIASMSCKAAIKGNNEVSFEEADHLIQELLTMENPYACPHGRPTMISISKTELEKKFKRIV